MPLTKTWSEEKAEGCEEERVERGLFFAFQADGKESPKMQSWYFDRAWGLINLSRQELFGDVSSVLPSGHRVAEEHKEHDVLWKGSASLTRDGERRLFACVQTNNQNLPQTALEMIAKLAVKYADMLRDNAAAIVWRKVHK